MEFTVITVSRLPGAARRRPARDIGLRLIACGGTVVVSASAGPHNEDHG